MNILVVSTYPPMPCGIGAYAAQEVAALRREGNAVDVFSPPEGDGDLQGDLLGGWKILRLVKHLWAYDCVHVHYTPSFFYNGASRWNKTQTAFAFWLLSLLYGSRLRFVIHETAYKINEPIKNRFPLSWLERRTWKRAGELIFHSARERDAFALHYRLPETRPNFSVLPHDRHFVPFCSADRTEARKRLNVPENKILFLCIGFIQPHKGYDRVLRAMRHVESPNALLRIVGSVRIPWQPALDYARELHALAAQDSRCEFIEEFITDELFDLWIIASDYVVVPYREIWSSSIAARAKLHQRPMIASEAGGLREQLTEGSYCFKTENELVEILKKEASKEGP